MINRSFDQDFLNFVEDFFRKEFFITLLKTKRHNIVSRSFENAGYPNGVPNWGTYLGTPKKQIYQDY